MKRVLPGLVALLLLAACNNIAAPTLELPPSEDGVVTVYFDPATGDWGIYEPETSQLGPAAIDASLCLFYIERPHPTRYDSGSGMIAEVKVAASGQCPKSEETDYTATAWLELEKESFLGIWFLADTTFKNPGPKISQFITPFQGGSWRRNSLLATAPCKDGNYRGKVNFEITNDDGIGGSIGFNTYGTETEVRCTPRSAALIVDDTGSMGSQISAVKSSLRNYINSIPEDQYTLWNLTTFKDSVSNRGTTDDRNTILSQVSSLSATGGADCPEEVLGAVSSGISTLSAYPDHTKDLVVITDASAQPGNVSGIIAAANLDNVRVSVLLSGDCGESTPSSAALATLNHSYYLSSQVVLKEIVEATGGRYYYIPGGTQQDYETALNEIFAFIENSSDAAPPTVTLSAEVTTLWPPDHTMRDIGLRVSAKDDTDPDPLVELVGVVSTEPADGQGDGNTEGDVEIGADGTIRLRAERSGTNNDRVYTITYRATDASGNTGFGSIDILVPHDQGN